MSAFFWTIAVKSEDVMTNKSPVRSSARAFTLVELLVVIGIIAVLISILLPALGQVREKSRQTKCLSNLRQLAMAAIAYSSENAGAMPGRGGSGMSVNIPGDPTSTFDWIAWQHSRDPVTGTTSSGADLNLTYSALAKFLGIRPAAHTSAQEAVQISQDVEDVFVCPSDPRTARPRQVGSTNIYRYSYSMNLMYSTPVFTVSGFGRGERSDGKFNGTLSSIRKASEKVLFVCEDERTLDDGTFSPSAQAFVDAMNVNAVADRHEARRADLVTTSLGITRNRNARGNVVFADGHGEFFDRKSALSRRHSGNPTQDPPGF